MIFSSLYFLLIFLPILLLIYFLVKDIKIKNYVLLAFSLLFYAWGEPIYVILMIFSIRVTYDAGLIMSKSKKKKLVLTIAIILLLLSLFFFKYANFFIDNINGIFGTNIKSLALSLPIGISFYTFQAISYLVDVYRGKTKVQNKFSNVALYISLFPQLIAGPIIRYETIEKEITKRKTNIKNVEQGLKRFIIGLSKKVIFANNLALIQELIFRNNIDGTLITWIGVISYSLQLYYDFSGYSDMAIGLGKVFGFNFSENFNYPYVSTSITEFWHRNHISLSNWFKDYVYIPLGGSRVSIFKHIRNILIVWILTGLWHGASWNFVIWGLYYGILLIIEKYVIKDRIEKIPKGIRYIITMILTFVGMAMFRLTELDQLLIVLKKMFIFTGSNFTSLFTRGAYLFFPFYLLIPAIIGIYPISKKIKLKDNFCNNMIVNIIYILLYITCIIFLASLTYNPFIYFRF